MAGKRPLKVYRTSIGFQDAYVAATSQKAALEAWGTEKNLFSAGLAELVTDPKLTKAPLAKPGAIVRASRGTAAQHLAAAKVVRPTKRETAKATAGPKESAAPPPPKKKQPRPSRAKLERAEAALERKRRTFQDALDEIDARIAGLRKERDQILAQRDEEISSLGDRRDAEEEAYRAKLDEWDG